MKTKIHVWHLEITDARLIPELSADRSYTINQLSDPTPELARFLYATVGAPWGWYMRLPWTYGEWKLRTTRCDVQFWLASRGGQPLGYFELEIRPDRDVEICFFGLMPEFIGQGLGKQFLEDALATAWDQGGKRVWLHTCSLDHPSALSNYKARGLRVFKEEDVIDEIPDEPPQPWQGAQKGAQ